MARTELVNIQTFGAIMMASMFIIFLQVVEMSPSIDEQIFDSSTSPHTFDMFHILPNGSIGVKLELDMMFTLEQYKAMKATTKKQFGKSSAVKFLHYRWPNGIMYYEITQSANKFRQVITAAIASYHKYTCISMVESNTAVNRVQFVDGDGCFSNVGMIGGIQILSINAHCVKGVGNIIHKLGHTLGFYHEHSRPDRDKYVHVDLSKIRPEYHPQLGIIPISYINTFNISYDYRSVMHFSSARGVITTLDPDFQNIIGHAHELSFKDIQLASLMYNCHVTIGKCPQNIKCPFEGFPYFRTFDKLEKCTCVCDSGDRENPLANCMKIAKPPAGRINFPQKSSSYLNKTECMDMRTDCATLKKKHHCSINLRTMYTQCTKTCNFCGKGENLCMDYEDGCHMMAGSGACKDETLKEAMSGICRKSCGLCQASTPCGVRDDLF